MDWNALSGGYGGGPSMGTIGQRPALPGLQSPPVASQGPSGVTRRGSQMVDAQGNVIGHYGNNNEAIYNAGQGPQGGGSPSNPNDRNEWIPPWGGENWLPRGGVPLPPWADQNGPHLERWGIGPYGGPVATTSMGMDPRYQRMQLPGGQVQDVPSAYAPNYLQQGGSLTGESTQYPAYSLSNVGRSGYRY
jgi:hypothetical protein